MTERVFSEDVAAAALPLVVSSIGRAVQARGRATVGLSGGSTPLPLYELLANASVPWEDVWVFLSDERYVPPDHPHRNSRAARRVLLDKVPVPEQQILEWPTELAPVAAAESFATRLQEEFGGAPVFDLNLLGLGDDAHTASLFPHTGAVFLEGLTLALQAPAYASPAGWRLTLSASALSSSREVVFLVSGEGKREALTRTFLPATTAENGAQEERVVLDAAPARAISALERRYLVTDVEF